MPAITIMVSNAPQLAAAIKSATGGETVLLAPGDYGWISIKGRMLAETVTIKSADPDNDARISDLRIDRSSGFRIEDVDLERPLRTGEADFTNAAYISNSSNIQLAGIDFRGSMDGNAANDGVALRIGGSRDVSVTGSTFEQWSHAGIFASNTGLTVIGNTVSNVVKTFSSSNLTDSVFADNVFLGEPEIAAPQTGPREISAATLAELNTALAGATGGETILLAPGNYGQLYIKGKVMNAPVTIKSADSANDAVFSDIRIHESTGFQFSDVDIHRPLLPGEGDFIQAVYVSDSRQIDFVGVDFFGSLDNNPWNDGVGLRVGGSQDIRVVDSTFEQLNNAMVFSHVSRLAVVGNTVFDVREGMNFSAVNGVMVAQNRLYGFDPNYAAGDHSDGIQFFTAGVNVGSNDVTIRDNIIMQGANGGTQGMFITSQVAGVRHADFTIENNIYNGDARHGITVQATDGVVVRNNTVTSAPGGRLEAGINIQNNTAVIIESNITPLLLQSGNSNIVISNNLDLWDRNTKAGASLSDIFEVPTGGLFSEDSFVSRTEAGFQDFNAIGAAEFDLSSFAGSPEVGILLQSLLIA